MVNIMDDFNKNLIEMLNNGTCCFTCIKYIKEILLSNGYQELREDEYWDIKPGKYFVIRNDASIIAFNIKKNCNDKFSIICTHSDTPGFMIKLNPEFYENGYLKLNVVPYGGILNYGFMDRPLGIAGRIITKQNGNLKKEIIDLDSDVAVIPSIAIHQKASANTNLDLNPEVDLIPIISLNKDYSLKKLIEDKLKIKNIFDFDLYLYNRDKAKIINNEFILSPRIDNLTCSWAAVDGFINNMGDNINVLAIFNSEEIGSNTYEGADSNFLIDVLKRICGSLDLELAEVLAKSFIISADNTHAKHPNHIDLADHTNTPELDEGVLIIKEVNGTTNGITSAIFKDICDKNNITYSYYTSRNDFQTGSTQAGASLKHLSINSLDVGLAMLAMHSGVELIGINDTYTLSLAFKKFYQTNYDFIDDKIIFKKK